MKFDSLKYVRERSKNNGERNVDDFFKLHRKCNYPLSIIENPLNWTMEEYEELKKWSDKEKEEIIHQFFMLLDKAEERKVSERVIEWLRYVLHSFSEMCILIHSCKE